MEDDGGQGSAEQAVEGSMAGGPFPEHAEQEGCEDWGIHKTEDQLQEVHDVIHILRHIGEADRDDDTRDGGEFCHPHVVFIGFPRGDVGLVNIVGPNGIEGGDVASHARHERGHEGRHG